MSAVNSVLHSSPLIALFITLTLGYSIGKLRIKTFTLGGIAGSLLIGVLVGQWQTPVPSIIGSIFFALFIYAVGYQGGPQFFHSLNKKAGLQLVSSTITCLLGLLCVLVLAWLFHLDRGTAAGLAAGGLTQSALIGTANDAIAKLPLSPIMINTLQTHVAVGYAVCYIFGSLGPILMLTCFFPLLMRWNIRQEAKKLASNSPNPTQTSKLEPGQFQPLKEVSTRVFEIQPHSSVIGKNLLELFDLDHRRFAAVEALIRAGQAIELRPDLCLQAHDIVAVTASTENFLKPHALFEKEIAKPALLNLTEEVRDVILTNNHFSGKSIQQCYEDTTPEDHYGLFVSSVTRLGETLKADDHLILKRGDEIRLIGRPADLDRLSSRLGRTLPATKVTDFITFCFGIALGLLLGLIVVHLFGISVSLGTGGGCLLSGLIMGWLKSRHPRIGTLPHGASNFLRDFGLTVFVAVIGLNAGPQAITAIKQQGIELFLLGMGVTLIPQILSFFISFYLLKIKNPIELLATLAGGRSANPGFAALLEKAGNATPVVAFTVTYAIANILLTLWGPIIIALITKN